MRPPTYMKTTLRKNSFTNDLDAIGWFNAEQLTEIPFGRGADDTIQAYSQGERSE